MNSTPQDLASKTSVKWLLGIGGVLFILGATWLASFLLAYPQESLGYARKYGVFLWIAVVLAWSVQRLARNKERS